MGVLFSKTMVSTSKNGVSWVKAVNFLDTRVILFKNQKVGIVTEVEIAEPFSIRDDNARVAAPVSVRDSTKAVHSLGIYLSGTAAEGKEKEELEKLLASYADVFSDGKRDLGNCKLGVQHHIHLKPDTVPVKQHLRRIPFAYKEDVKKDLKAMMEDGVIEKSHSQWASPLVIVRKSSGDLRICVDYRKLNQATQVTSYPLPNITEALDRLSEASYFTTIDMVSGYHQVEVAPEDRDKTAFITPYGLFQYCRMPFGLAGAPGTFQLVLEDMLQVLEAEDMLTYLDDVICFHSNFEEHLQGIERLLRAVRNAGFKLSGKKCQFATQSVNFLGHTIDRKGVRPQPEKTEIIREWPTPHNEFVLFGAGLFVPGFSQIAAPLHELLNKPKFHWTQECEQAFITLKRLLCNSVILALPNQHGRFAVTCDAPDKATGFYLEQIDSNGDMRPIAFGGKKLTKAETNYSTAEKECLAIMHALNAYRPYLLGREFDLYTDHESLKWLLTRTQDHSGRLWRWIEKFREFQCGVHHIAGKKNIVADALSQVQKVEIGEEEWSLESIRRQQDACSVLKTVKSWISNTAPPPETVHGKEFSTWHKLLPRLTMGTDLVLCYENPRTKEKLIVLPSNLGERAFRMPHDEMGHLGSIKTLERIRARYFWPSMASDIMNWCNTCIPCQQRRNPVPGCRAPLQSIVTSRPGEVVAMDIVEYTKSSRGSRYCLVMIDHFTKWLELFPLRNQRSETIAKKI